MTARMNPKVRAQWIAALRSGEYKQTRGKLRNDDGFCCLGVLCDLWVKEGNGEWEEAGASELPRYKIAGEWAGLASRDPYVTVPGPGHQHNVNITALNDKGASFSEIADLIEEQF